MRRHSTHASATILIAALAAAPAVAAQESQVKEQSSGVEQQVPQQHRSGLGRAGNDRESQQSRSLFNGDQLVGLDVKGREGDSVGKIHDVLFTPNGGASAVIVSAGGVLGIGDTHIRVPWDQVIFDANLEHARVPVAEDNVDTFKWGADDEKARGNELRVSRLQDSEVVLQDGSKYGDVKDVIIRRDGELSALFISPDEQDGQERAPHLYSRQFSFNSERERITIPYTRDQVVQAPAGMAGTGQQTAAAGAIVDGQSGRSAPDAAGRSDRQNHGTLGVAEERAQRNSTRGATASSGGMERQAQQNESRMAEQRDSGTKQFRGARATGLIGSNVSSSDKERLGVVRDLAVNMSTGEVRHAIVSAKGGERVRAVPLQALRTARDGTLTLGTDVYHDASARDLLGTDVNAVGGQKLGELTDLIVDMDRERVSYGVLERSSGQLVALPIAAFMFQPEEAGGEPRTDQLVLNVGSDHLDAMTPLDRSAWSQLKEPGRFVERERSLLSIAPAEAVATADSGAQSGSALAVGSSEPQGARGAVAGSSDNSDRGARAASRASEASK